MVLSSVRKQNISAQLAAQLAPSSKIISVSSMCAKYGAETGEDARHSQTVASCRGYSETVLQCCSAAVCWDRDDLTSAALTCGHVAHELLRGVGGVQEEGSSPHTRPLPSPSTPTPTSSAGTVAGLTGERAQGAGAELQGDAAGVACTGEIVSRYWYLQSISTRAWNEGYAKVHEDFTSRRIALASQCHIYLPWPWVKVCLKI